MASLLEINGVAPSEIIVGDAHAKVVTVGDNWAVWAKFDDPRMQDPINPMQPYKITSVSGASLMFTPTSTNPSTVRATGSIILDMNMWKLDVEAYVERTLNGIHQEFAQTTWRFDVSLKDSRNSVLDTMLTTSNYSYNVSSTIGNEDRFYLTVGINDTSVDSGKEFKPYFEFRLNSNVLKRVESSYLIMSEASYLNGYPQLYSAGTGLRNIGDILVGVAYIDE